MVAALHHTSEEQRGGLQEQIKMELSPGNYMISIDERAADSGVGETKAWLWLEGSGPDSIENPLTGKSCSYLWHTLNGRDEMLRICIHRPITIHALCLEKTGYESKGGIKVRYLPL
jgi:hypothetical protein